MNTNSAQTAIIKKANWVRGERLVFRNVDGSDAEFIFALRTDAEISKYLSKIAPSIQKQMEWLESYKTADDQAYFIIETSHGEKIGTLRFYDPKGTSLTWGSWIIKSGFPASFAVESALMAWHYAFYTLDFDSCHFDIIKGNESVQKFNVRFGAKRVGETDEAFLYILKKQDIEPVLLRHRKLLPNSIKVQFMEDFPTTIVDTPYVSSRFPIHR